MNEQHSPHNPDALAQLMLDYLQGQLTEQGYEQLVQGLEANPEEIDRFVELAQVVAMSRELCRLDGAARREFVLQADPERNIQELIAAMTPPDDLEPIDYRTIIEMDRAKHESSGQSGWDNDKEAASIDIKRVLMQSLRQVPRRWVAGSIAALIALGAILAVVLLTPGNTPQPGPIAGDETVVGDHVAVLTDVKNARWESSSGEAAPMPGDMLAPNRRLVLTGGFASIRTQRGAVAILEAPCTVQLTDDNNAIRLIAGKMVGVVESDAAKGFKVRTATAVITDMGTRFGVTYDGTTRTRVIEGEVIVDATEGAVDAQPVRLIAGQSAEVDAETAMVVRKQSLPDTFVADWAQVRRQPGIDGEIRFKTHMPRSLALSQSEDDRIVMFLERSGAKVDRPVMVTAKAPGRHKDFGQVSLDLPAQQAVDSYLFHLDLPGEAPAGSRRSATVVFERPIVAVIARSDQLLSSDDVFGQQGVAYPQGKHSQQVGGVRGMEPASAAAEGFTISDDRLTLTIDMTLVGTSIDQARVLVQAKGGVQ